MQAPTTLSHVLWGWTSTIWKEAYIEMDGGCFLVSLTATQWKCTVGCVWMCLHMTPFLFLLEPLCWIRNHDRKSAFSERQTPKQTGWDTRRKWLKWRWEEEKERGFGGNEEEAKKGKGRQGETVLPQGASSHPSERWVGLFHDCTFVFQIRDTPPPQKKQKKRKKKNPPSHLNRALSQLQ